MKRGPIDADVLAARTGDRAAMERVLASVERLCIFITRKSARRLPDGMDFDEGVQVCRVAVLDAIRMYRPGVSSFGNYAAIWMRARLKQAIEREAAGVSPKVVDRKTWKLRMHRAVPLDEATRDGLSPIDTLAHEGPSAEDVLLDGEKSERLKRALSKLEPRQRVVIEGRLRGRLLGQVGQQLNISRERVRQLEVAAVGRLRVLLGTGGGLTELHRPVRAAHGTRNRFRAGCRCDPCRNSIAEAKRRQRRTA